MKRVKCQDGMKWCSKCKQWLPFENFWKRKPTGLVAHCKKCRSSQILGWQRNKRKDPEYAYWRDKKWNLFKKGVTIDEYQSMVKSQKGRCAICGRKQQQERLKHNRNRDALCVDHSHSTGKIRGLLCVKCNQGIGCFGEDVGRMRAAIEYLVRLSVP